VNRHRLLQCGNQHEAKVLADFLVGEHGGVLQQVAGEVVAGVGLLALHQIVQQLDHELVAGQRGLAAADHVGHGRAQGVVLAYAELLTDDQGRQLPREVGHEISSPGHGEFADETGGIAGDEPAPTANLMASVLRMVLTDGRFRGHLSGGQMTLPDALEQVLWDHPPLAVVPTRWATGDTQLGGTRIMAGDMVMLGLAAGNVDPSIRPDLTVPMQGNRSHLAFGAGVHECPGQDLGRAIAEAGVDLLLERIPDLHLAVDDDQVQVVGTWMARRITSLPVAFAPQREERPAAVQQRPEPPVRHDIAPAPGERAGSRWFRRRRP
jgi:hypothetical protein